MTRARAGAIHRRYLAVCRECSDGPAGQRLGAYVAPHEDRGTCDAWARDHQERNPGHHVKCVEGWPNARTAYRRAFGDP